MTVTEMIKKLQEFAAEGKENFPIKCTWTETDEDGEEYTIREDAFMYAPCTQDEIWITY